MPLPGGLGADIDIDKAVIGEADLRPLGRIAAGGLQVVRQPETAPLAPRRRLRLAGGEAGVVDVSTAASRTTRKSPLS